MKHVYRLLLMALLVAIPLTGILAQDNATIADMLTESASAKQPEFTVLLEMLQATDLLDTLSGDGPYILFAPTDAAFADFFDLTEMDKEVWLAVPEVTTDILVYHIAESDMPLADIVKTGEIATLGSSSVAVEKEKKNVLLDGFSTIIDGPTEAGNGVIYTIDSVLVPMDIEGDQTSGDACTISTPDKNTVAVRVGPGENRTSVVFLQAGTDFAVSGRFVDEAKGVWYKLDPAEAAPGRAINEAWVSADGLDETGDCEAVGDASAPPIIPITSSQPNPSGNSGGNAASEPGAMPQAGRWTLTFASTFNASCQGTGNVSFQMTELGLPMTSTWNVQASGANIIIGGDTFTPNGAGAYVGSMPIGGNTVTGVIRVSSSTFMSGEFILSFDKCSATLPFTLTR